MINKASKHKITTTVCAKKKKGILKIVSNNKKKFCFKKPTLDLRIIFQLIEKSLFFLKLRSWNQLKSNIKISNIFVKIISS